MDEQIIWGCYTGKISSFYLDEIVIVHLVKFRGAKKFNRGKRICLIKIMSYVDGDTVKYLKKLHF